MSHSRPGSAAARPRATGGQRVLLWPDTFNNYFRPETAIAATRALEAVGFEVAIPPRPLCCGRPLYDWGWLSMAQRLWRQTMTVLRTEIEAGMPLIGLEPACLTAFRDELLNLFPNDALAKRLSEQSIFFSDFLADHAEGLNLRQDGAKALVHIHCHQHAVIKADGERHLLDKLGVDYEVLPSGCCGMAGAFGFAPETYDVSVAVGERVLLPRVRTADSDTLVLDQWLQLPRADRARDGAQNPARRRIGRAMPGRNGMSLRALSGHGATD